MSAMPRIDRGVRSLTALAAACLLVARAVSAHAQGVPPILLQGIADVEGWSTTAHSNLLTRNDGKLAALGRVQLWGAIEPWRGIVLYAQGEAIAGSALSVEDSAHVYTNQFGVRYAPSRALVFDAGRLPPIVGTFAPRQFSTRNPLIGSPDGYSLEYPLAIEVSGEMRHFDYRAAMVSLPASHLDYVPRPTPRLRPAIGGGFTPMTGLRIGASFTIGPYLNNSYSSAALAGRSWTAYDQRIAALDFAFAHGYLETHAEYARGSYDVPGRATAIVGATYYGEVKYTLSPRFFVAARAERNRYPFIRPFGTNWVARITDFTDGEIGGGFRLTASTLLKASARGDRWWFPTGASGFRGTGGPAVAVQVSQAFDVASWFDHRR
jgi:hypothetical protein